MTETRIRGLNHILSRLSEPMYAKPWRDALEGSALIAEDEGIQHAPVDTGWMRSQLTHSLDPATVPLWAKVGTNVRARGVSYPAVLEAGTDRRGRRYHYRRGPRAGQPTEKWLGGSIVAVAPRIKARLEKAAKQIEASWRG